MVDDEVDGDQRVDLLRVAAERVHRVAHRRQIDDAGHAGEVLHQHARRAVLDLALGRLGGQPFDHRLEIGDRDGDAVLEAQQILEQHLHREGEPRDVAELFRRFRQRIIMDRLAADLERVTGAEAVLSDRGHAGILCWERRESGEPLARGGRRGKGCTRLFPGGRRGPGPYSMAGAARPKRSGPGPRRSPGNKWRRGTSGAGGTGTHRGACPSRFPGAGRGPGPTPPFDRNARCVPRAWAPAFAGEQVAPGNKWHRERGRVAGRARHASPAQAGAQAPPRHLTGTPAACLGPGPRLSPRNGRRDTQEVGNSAPTRYRPCKPPDLSDAP